MIISYDRNITPYPHLKINQKLTFQITEIDVDSKEALGEYEEEFTQIQELTITTKDYLKSHDITNGQFKNEWE